MKISSFYKNSRCEKISAMENVIREENRYLVLARAIKGCCSSLVDGGSYDDVYRKVSAYLKETYSGMEHSFAWQDSMQAENDSYLFKRFFTWLSEQRLVPVKANLTTSILLNEKLSDGSITLDGMVNLIVSDAEGNYQGFIIHPGTSSRSLRGKTLHTNARTDLHVMVAKLSLESTYPGIVINSVYLSSSKDTPSNINEKLDVHDGAASNMHRIDFAEYCEEGCFDSDALMAKVGEVLSTDFKNSCDDCRWFCLCKTPPIVTESESDSRSGTASLQKGYVMPSFTEEQLNVVTHLNGPMRVCAGPGSGKTATLIGRIKYLIEEKGITPEFILVVTFTNEAANELRQRCLSFLPESRLPKIATLNGFCYGILRENASLLENGLKLLDSGRRLELIKAISSVTKPLAGFKYDVEDGKYGVYRTIANRLDFYFSCLNDSEFFYKYPDCGKDFLDFAGQYTAAVKDGGYITFDEQITLCNKLFKEHPEVLNIYQSIYQYIMVDEYQDVNKDQVEMLYALASHQNIVVVGDDDQGIYGFRGASSAFMIDFEKDFPGAKTIVLRDNFRSTKAIVEASASLIKNNVNRIDKNIRSGRTEAGNDVLPVLVPSMEVSAIESVVDALIEEGFSYDDIAILSTKNAPLEELHNTLSVPTVLAKNYLRNDSFFLLLYSILKLYNDINNDRAFYQFMQLHGVAEMIQREKGLSLSQAVFKKCGIETLDDIGAGKVSVDCPFLKTLNMLYTYIEIIFCSKGLKQLLETVRIACNWKNSNSYEELLSLIEQQNIASADALLSFMERTIEFDDDKRVEVERGNRLLLITSHDSKGKEFKVVLLRNDYSSGGEEIRRLFYVAMTRAKERLYILQDSNAKADFLCEIPHEVMSL